MDAMNIYVGNLSLEVTEEELRQEFMAFGEVISITIMNNKYIEQWFDLEDECGAIAYKKKTQKELQEIIDDLYKKYP